ncbi:putative sterigmatocystin biosynthesis P450 monooxygenase stcS [Lasiodiplodia hormozganensis]|uniref:Sterigmatocystin biosynthesis P450 monooxygenase stcS n=1 Tax=Lasiodiplodia hormozganensis TaxID=869390 RepID=A0AA40CHL4_9PEZI|nr:putative sterigmatocystin biosynthesis P450 monooxygenase stcS [Lasiodiplodia hormozganensis]
MDEAAPAAPARYAVTMLVALAGGIIYILLKAYRARKIVNDLRKQGYAMPKFNWITGHMLAIKPFVDKLPPDAITNYIMTTMAFAMKKNAFYLDFWPLSDPILVVTSPQLASQLTQEFNPLKPGNINSAFAHLCGGPNLFTMPDGPWKRWRAIFNPGFSPTYMLDQTPKIVDQCRIFCDKMRQRVRAGEMFPLEEDTLRLTLDVIGIVSMDTDFNYQHGDSDIPKSLRGLIEWVSFGTEMNPFNRWTPRRPFMISYYGRKVDKFIDKELQKRYAERKTSLEEDQKQQQPRSKKAKSIVALALDAYAAETQSDALDSTFLHYARSQIRLFLFAGHDTTSSAMIYVFHYLSLHPPCLARLRAEHDAVLGPDRAAAGDVLSAQPTLLNQLPYTTACIREALRLFPPASSLRVGGVNTVLVDEDGTRYPTAGCNVWALHLALQRNPAVWGPTADQFLPERWLVGPDDPLHPPKGAWRPFEFGPRNCIGQTLAMSEMKIVLAMTAREFDFRDAYEEWDGLHPSKHIKTALGDRAYQVEGGGGGSHAANRYPCRVYFACERS